MYKFIVISVRDDCASFVGETKDGQCAVYIQHSGVPVQVGDILSAERFPESCLLIHSSGCCGVRLQAGLMERGAALDFLQKLVS